MILVADIETNGLFNEVTQIHCIVTKNKETGDVRKFFNKDLNGVNCDGTITDGITYLSSADLVVGHNWIDYDARVIQKLFPGGEIRLDKIRDTYIRSLLFDPHRERHPRCPPSKLVGDTRRVIGPHGLENWGYIVGMGKIEHEDWSELTPQMVERCVRDVEITDEVDTLLDKQERGWDWSVAEDIEKKFRLILSEQEACGWLFDVAKANELVDSLSGEIDQIDGEVLPSIPPRLTSDKKTYKQVRLKDGGYHRNFAKWFDDCGIGPDFNVSSFGGEYSRVSFEPINLASNDQVKQYLLSVGWEPTEWNYKKDGKKFLKDEEGKNIPTSPKLTEDSFGSLGSEIGRLIAKRIVLCHRRSQIQGWLNEVREDSRIGAGGNSVGTNTGRVTHFRVVNVPKAEDGVFYGKEMRSLFKVPPGKALVGADLTALEDRLAGHQTYKYDDGAYATQLLEGDTHQRTADLFGCSRFKGKTANHGLKYGAQPPKLAEILGCSVGRAKMYWDMWWKMHPSLHSLKSAIESALDRRGFIIRGRLREGAFIKGLDGRKIFLRSLHSALNARIQNAGSVVNKLLTIYIWEGVNERWLDARFVGNFHDESQAEVALDDVEEYKEIVRGAVDKVNKFFDFKIPMDISVKVGYNWCDTH